MVGLYQMVNIKLDKAAGLTEALLLRERALDLSLGFMVALHVGQFTCDGSRPDGHRRAQISWIWMALCGSRKISFSVLIIMEKHWVLSARCFGG